MILHNPAVIGALAAVAALVLALFFGLHVIGEDESGLVIRRFGRALPPGRILATDGEAGYQAEMLSPGWHFPLWRWRYKVTRVPMVVVSPGQIALVVAADGAGIPSERVLGREVACDSFQDATAFLRGGGERGRQLGILTAGTYRINPALIASLKAAPSREVAALARALVATRVFEARAVAYELIERRRDALAVLGARGVLALAKGNDNWASVDHHGVAVAGPAWRLGVVRDADIARWARSKDRWRRRAALVATVGLNARSRGGTGDAPRTLAVCDRLAGDRDDMVVKALSWALRELAKHDAGIVTQWLTAHAADLHPRILREVRSKLETGRKVRRLHTRAGS